MTESGPMLVGDARGLPAEVLGDLRRRVVAAVESGLAQTEAARVFGVSRQTVGVWVRDYRNRGEHAFRPGRRGRKPGEQLALTVTQQLRVIRTITAGPPDAVGLRYPLWTRHALIELVHREFLVPIGVTTAGNYLQRWGFPLPQDLLRDLRGRNALVAADGVSSPWVAGAEVVWVGHGKPGWGCDSDIGVLRAVSNRAAMSFLACTDPYSSAAVHDFLSRLVRQARRTINIIVTWLPGRGEEDPATWAAFDGAAVRFISA